VRSQPPAVSGGLNSLISQIRRQDGATTRRPCTCSIERNIRQQQRTSLAACGFRTTGLCLSPSSCLSGCSKPDLLFGCLFYRAPRFPRLEMCGHGTWVGVRSRRSASRMRIWVGV
jgi:hypothetical protein